MRRKYVLRCLSCVLAGMLLLDAPLQVFAEKEAGASSTEQSEDSAEEDQDQPKPQEGEGQTDDLGDGKAIKPQENPTVDDTLIQQPSADLDKTSAPASQQPKEPAVTTPPSSNDTENPSGETLGNLDDPEPNEPEADTPKEEQKSADKEDSIELKDFFVLSGVQYGSILEEEPAKASEELLTEYKNVLEVLQSALQEKVVEADLREQNVDAEVLQKLLTYLVNDSDTDCSMLLPKITYYYIEENESESKSQNVQKVLLSYLSEEDKLVLRQVNRTLEAGAEFSFAPDKDAEGYRLYRCSAAEEEWKLADEFAADTDGTCIDPLLDDGEYTYLLVAYQTEGGREVICNFSRTLKSTYTLGTPENSKVEVSSAYSEPATRAVSAVPEKAATEETITIPAVELSAAPAAYNQIRLDWKEAVPGVSYEIYKKEADGSWQLAETIPAGRGLTWTDTSVLPGIAYTYQIRGVRTQQGKSYEGAYSGEVTVATELDAVGGLVVGTSDMQSLNISWKEVPGADGYELYRSVSSGSGYSLLATLPSQTLSYQDNGLSLGGAYYYQVRAYISANGKKVYGAYAPEVGGTVKLSEVQDITVTQIKATALRLSWKSAPDAQSYDVYYSTSPDSGYIRLKNVKKTSFDFTKAKCGVTYYFKIKTLRKDGKVKIYGDDSVVVSGKTALIGNPEITVKKVTYNSIALKWTKVKDAKKYEIWYATAPDGDYQLLKTQGGTGFTHKNLTTGQTYYYKVYPIRDSFRGDVSNVVSAKSTLEDLSGLKVARSGNNGMKLSWKKVKGASEYVILRSTQADGGYTEVARTNATKYTDAGLAAGITYYYQVYATSGVVDSKPAGPIGQSTPAQTPATPTQPSQPSSDSSSNVSTKPLYYGVDVSSYQGKIDWESAADDGVDFAMIRILTGKGTYDLSLDSRFEYNYRNARAAGVKVGVYRYSYATSRGGARREARRIVEVLDGRKLEYPIVLDLEDSSILENTSKADRTEIILGFKDIVESAGYKFALYANKTWIDNYIDPAALKGVDIWFARWRGLDRGPGYSGPGNLAMWQYSDSGRVNGIPGNVDLDVSYKRY